MSAFLPWSTWQQAVGFVVAVFVVVWATHKFAKRLVG